MKHITRPTIKPRLHLRVLVSGVVVQDQVDFSFGIRRVEDSEEIQEVLMLVVVLAFTDHLACGNVKRCEERGRAVSFIIISTALRMAELHGKKRFVRFSA